MSPSGAKANSACTLAAVSGMSVAAQYLSVMPSQALVTSKVSVFLLSLVAKDADQPFVQDVVAERGRGAVTRDARIRIERHRRGAFVDDLVLDGEQVVLVDGDGPSEFQSLAVVIDEGHRPADGERSAALLPPDRVRRRNF